MRNLAMLGNGIENSHENNVNFLNKPTKVYDTFDRDEQEILF